MWVRWLRAQTKTTGELSSMKTTPRWNRIVKAEQWFKQPLKVTEADYIWCTRLGDTFVHVLMHDAGGDALEYLKEAPSLEEGNAEILYAMLQHCAASKKDDEARSIIQNAVTETVAGMVNLSLVVD
ncbi:hypothetical protein BDV27DRAFT_158674 [Aspergillus caelatus]|uniref:Uncharacterized protein n=1 Tax=Aspergillus caelatus TaxID=61420 RepID=A0A5N7A146_9EURO|nr:uncharacterized protein BDV27DRAFT_158674 [Aspergillus caelatus]KAE8363581.1 hypothetical protein BDV27DRAFT_158674 [Aspergillus caelatus]